MQKRSYQTFLVLVSRNVGIMRSISVAALHLVSFLSITSTCTCALCGLTLRRCFPTLSGVFVLLAVVWRTRATGRLSEVLGFCGLQFAGLVHCPLGFYGTFGFLSSSWSLQVYSWPVFLCWWVTTFALRRVTWFVSAFSICLRALWW